MSSEVCPFCGKTYKRLKSHLPHCKAAGSSKTPPHQQDVAAKQTSSSQPAAALSQSTQATSVTTDLHTKKSKKVSGITSGPLQSSTAMPSKSAGTQSSSLPPTVKKKQKLADQIKMAITLSSATVSSPTLSKPKKKSVRALIEAVNSEQVSKRSLGETKPPFLTDHPNSRNTAQTETKMKPDKDSASLDLLSTDTKPKHSHQKKMSKTKKAAQSDFMDVKIKERPFSRDKLWEDNMGEIEDLSVNKMRSTPRSIHQARITLQDVRAALCRPKATSQSSRTSILSQVDSGDNLSSKSRGGTGLSPAESQKDSMVTAETLSDQLPPTSSQHTGLQSVTNESSKCKEASSVALQHDGSPQPKTTVPATPLLSGHMWSQVSQPTFLPHTVSVTEGLKMGHHRTGLLSISPPAQLSSLHPFLLAPPARVDTLRANEGSTAETAQLVVRKQTTAHSRPEGALTQCHLGQVRLRELPDWLFSNTPSRPKDAVKMVQRGWQWYYRRYIDVKKGGVGGLGMLLAGYCVLSYIWSYPHTKRDRWRKYH